ncbi:MAG: hypothetical protein AAFQ82_12940 [Myxococcota bacterium]
MDSAELDLLELLDTLVRRDPAPSGLSGELCIGVRENDAFRWWSAAFTPALRVGFDSVRSNSAHATLVLDAADARELLTEGRIAGPNLLAIDGDRRLLRRFFRRYTSKTNWLGIRLGAAR